MIKFILIGIAGLMLACSNSKEVKSSKGDLERYDVTINATTTQAYCGGAKPSEEVLEELNTPKPASNVKIYLRKGDSNNIDNDIDFEFTTNDSGRVETRLPEGKYSIVFENKKDRATYDSLLEKYGKETVSQTAIDTNCLSQFFAEPNAVLEVKKGAQNNITVNRLLRCQWTNVPCSNYKGQLPPSAPPK